MPAKRVVRKISTSQHPLRVEEGHDGKSVLINRTHDYNWEISLTPSEAESMGKALLEAAKSVRVRSKSKAKRLLKEAKLVKSTKNN